MTIEKYEEGNCARYPRDSGSEHGGLWQEGPGSDRGPRCQNRNCKGEKYWSSLRWEDQGGIRWEEPMSEVEWGGGPREGGGGQRGHNHDGHRWELPWFTPVLLLTVGLCQKLLVAWLIIMVMVSLISWPNACLINLLPHVNTDWGKTGPFQT